jgi:hypothetical protein
MKTKEWVIAASSQKIRAAEGHASRMNSVPVGWQVALSATAIFCTLDASSRILGIDWFSVFAHAWELA